MTGISTLNNQLVAALRRGDLDRMHELLQQLAREVRMTPPEVIGNYRLLYNPMPVAAMAALLDYGVDDLQQSASDTHPLHVAAVFAAPRHLDLLVQHGAPIDVRDYRWETPLMHAARFDRQDNLRWLLEHGADPALLDHDRRSLLDHAFTYWCSAMSHDDSAAEVERMRRQMTSLATLSGIPTWSLHAQNLYWKDTLDVMALLLPALPSKIWSRSAFEALAAATIEVDHLPLAEQLLDLGHQHELQASAINQSRRTGQKEERRVTALLASYTARRRLSRVLGAPAR